MLKYSGRSSVYTAATSPNIESDLMIDLCLCGAINRKA